MTERTAADYQQLGRQLRDEVLQPIKATFVGKDEVVDLMGVALVAGENLFILGPPGTAKSALVQELSRLIQGRVFDYLLTRFTEPNELFGPFDIRRLREGELVTNTEGMLPEAELVFLDELLNANSAILNSLLTVLNERVFRRGRENRKLPTLMVIGASNRLPEDDALHALFDRFLLRVHCDNVSPDRLSDVLSAGWLRDLGPVQRQATLHVDVVRDLQAHLADVDIGPVRSTYVELIARLRQAGIPISDRRAVKLQRVVAASALLCGRLQADATDVWPLRYIWDREEQQEILASLVQAVVDQAASSTDVARHPRSSQTAAPNAEELAHDLERIGSRLSQLDLSDSEKAVLRDQAGVLASRCQWVTDGQQRTALEQRLAELWKSLGTAS